MDEKDLIEKLVLYKEKYKLTLKEISKRIGIHSSGLRYKYDLIEVLKEIKRLNKEGKSLSEISEIVKNNQRLPILRVSFPKESVDYWLDRSKDWILDVKKIDSTNELEESKSNTINLIGEGKHEARLMEKKSDYFTGLCYSLRDYFALLCFRDLSQLKEMQKNNTYLKKVYKENKNKIFLGIGYEDALNNIGSNFNLLKKIIKITDQIKATRIIEKIINKTEIESISRFLKKNILKKGLNSGFSVPSFLTDLKSNKVIKSETYLALRGYKQDWDELSKKIREIYNKKRVEPENITGLLLTYFGTNLIAWEYEHFFQKKENNIKTKILRIKNKLFGNNEIKEIDPLSETFAEINLLSYLRNPDNYKTDDSIQTIIKRQKKNIITLQSLTHYAKELEENDAMKKEYFIFDFAANHLRNDKTEKCMNCNSEFFPIFSIFAKDYPLANEETIQDIKYCDNCLASLYWGTNKPNKDKKNLIEDMKKFYGITNELPSRDKMGWLQLEIHAQKDKEKFHKLIKLLIEMYCAEDYLNTFSQSWIGVLIKTGLLENAKKTYYGTICFAKDDDLCLSLSEKKIDDWMFKNKIKHKKEWHYPYDEEHNPNNLLRCDWLIKNYYVEFFGLKGKQDYDDKITIKRRLCEKNNLNLIGITREDLKNLDKKLAILKIKDE